ncbi:unnamed protein product [Cuscuta epithymum]|uniref:LRAT domain-containing protein n=1 Tax=Cuscuta epithymum TaxID=186058 RepID=A0AAV0F7A0_9ASTE|nr:unnamed protein product [Cuscuta epithymum]
MGLLSQRVERSEIAAGDHIYTWRSAFAYAHHGIYVGGNKVVHFTASGGSMEADLSLCPKNILDCGFHKSESGVLLSCLDCFLKEGSLYEFEYGSHCLTFLTKVRGGTCTIAESDPPESVIYRAMYLLQNGFGKYDLFHRNCEDFALYCKTGLIIVHQQTNHAMGSSGTTGQVASALLGGALVGVVGSLFNTTTPVGLGLGTGTYLVNRYGNDIGVRKDVVKVDVEDIALFHSRQVSVEDICPTDVNDRKKGISKESAFD